MRCGVLTLACVALTAWAASASGQRAPPAPAARPDRVLVIMHAHMPYEPALIRALQSRKGADGESLPAIAVDVRYRASASDELVVARELEPVLKNYRAVFTSTQFMARAVQMLDAHIPIVFTGEDDPVPLCLVDSLGRPGRNATGYTTTMPDEDVKMLQALADGFPAVKRVVFLLDGGNVHPTTCSADDVAWKAELPPCVTGLRPLDPTVRRLLVADPVTEYGRRMGIAVRYLVMCSRADFAQVAALAAADPDMGFAVPLHTLFIKAVPELVGHIGRTGRPAIYGRHQFSGAGGLMSIEPILDEHDGHEAIDLLLKVLRGRSPATLPVQIPRGFTLQVNAAAAVAQGLRPDLALLRRADAVTWPEAPK